MKCRKCLKPLPVDARFCPACGAKQDVRQKTKSRGNGTGTVFKRGSSYIATVTLGYTRDEPGRLRRKTRSKSGFKTKKEALEYLPKLFEAPPEKPKQVTFKELYELWFPTHRAGDSTLGNYSAAVKYFSPIFEENISEITVDDLQDCIDDCPRGKRTRENMRAAAGLMYKYAIPRRLVLDSINMAAYLVVSGESGRKEGLPLDALEKIRAAVGTVPGADIVLCHCYLGFRPGELISLTAADYDSTHKAFIGGSKTDAGRNRIVTVSPKILPIVERLVAAAPSGAVFCKADGTPLSLAAYRALFYSVLDAAGIENPTETRDGVQYRTYTPHSCRHTFATLMKRVPGADKDKLELIGHTSTEMLRHYQDVDFTDLQKITDAL